MNSQSIELDQQDFAILAIVQRDSETPQRTIGEAVNLSAAAVQRRLKRMREAGVIRETVAILDPPRVGRPVTIVVAVEMASERRDQIQAAKDLFGNDPEVQQCYYVTGEVDFILVITLPAMSDYEAVMERLFFDNDNVRRFRSFVAVDSVKTSLQIPLGADLPRGTGRRRRR